MSRADNQLIARHLATKGVTRLPAAEASAPEPGESDYEMTVKLRNGRILSAMRRAGIKTQSELAERAGIPFSQLNILVNLRRAPLRTDGTWQPAAIAISDVLKCTPDVLFSEKQKTQALKNNKVVRPVSDAEVDFILDQQRAIPSPEDVVAQHERDRLLDAAIDTLRPRQAKIIRQRFGLDGAPKTLEEIAGEENVFRERIRQIELRGVRDLKHPSRSRALKDFA